MADNENLNLGARPNSLFVPVDWLPITPGATPLPRVIRAIRATTEGTVTVTTMAGESRVMAFLAGETRMIMATHVTAAVATGLEGAV